MKFLQEGRELLVTELSRAQLWQASAISDCIGRMIPHEGVDYDIRMSEGGFKIIPITDKGVAWKEYVERVEECSPPTGILSKTELSMHLCGMIPEEGIDYDPRVMFRGSSNKSLSLDIEAITPRGKFWRSYVMGMIKKYPPTTTYESERLPEEAIEVDGIPKEFEEGDQSEKIVH